SPGPVPNAGCRAHGGLDRSQLHMPGARPDGALAHRVVSCVPSGHGWCGTCAAWPTGRTRSRPACGELDVLEETEDGGGLWALVRVRETDLEAVLAEHAVIRAPSHRWSGYHAKGVLPNGHRLTISV